MMAPYPHRITSIEVTILDSLQLISAAINATCLALLDAGIPLSTTVASVTCAVTQEGELVLDPDFQEEQVRYSSPNTH